jgi:hypothetical protein
MTHTVLRLKSLGANLNVLTDKYIFIPLCRNPILGMASFSVLTENTEETNLQISLITRLKLPIREYPQLPCWYCGG